MSRVGARAQRAVSGGLSAEEPAEPTVTAWAVRNAGPGNANVVLERLRIPMSWLDDLRAKPAEQNAKGVVAGKIERELLSDRFALGDPWK